MRQGEPIGNLRDSIGYVLKQAATALHSAMDAALRPHELTVSQYSCLEQLSQVPDQTNAQLARRTFVTPQSMNDVLRGLQRRDLLERPSEAPTGRARPTRITPAGQDLLDQARQALQPVEQNLHGAMSAPDRQQMLTNLRSIIRAMEQGAAHVDPRSSAAGRTD